jgi:anaerobic magnesium-protoporphyrin IX monomethyl ester cyclase
MERIALVVPPGLPGTTPNHEGSSGLGAMEPRENGFRYAPHTVATMAAVLRDGGYDVLALDAVACALDAAATVKATLDARPRLVGVFVSWATRTSDQLFLELLSAACPTEVPVVACGISVRLMHSSLQEANYLLEGEPELSFCAVCDGLLRSGASLSRVIRSAEIAPAEYDESNLLRDLDKLPFPAWDLLPRERYSHLSILTSRGCPEGCVWCPYVVAQGHRFRACSPDRVIHELRDIVRSHHPRRVIVRDPAFSYDASRLERICRRIIGDRILRPGKRLLWECESRPEYLERRLLRLMSLAGCVGIKIGLETTDPDLLYGLGRLPTRNRTARYLARVASLARDCARLGIAYRVFAMVGLPGQTLRSVQETAGFVQALRPSALSAKVFKEYPGLALPSGASLPSPGEVEEQEGVLSEAQQAIDRENHRTPPHWRVMAERLVSRLVAVTKKG